MRCEEDRLCDNALAELKKGNSDALAVIYRTYGKMILSLSLRILHNKALAEDNLHDTVLLIMKNADKYIQGSNPRAWVLAIAHNNAVNICRTYKNQTELNENVLPAVSDSPEKYARISEALDSLNKKERTLVYLKLEAGLSHKEVAEVMHISYADARKVYERALNKMRRFF